ncbi:MAG: hypothetical protein K0R24_2122 [Gammaproteobacteria bacterium]|jgi:hypothetical protein|nr:hypothetical protein [Gammaproteobacteria bacterium]
MNKKFSLDQLEHFTGCDELFKHWLCRMHYTEGVKYLADETGSYWLIDEIAFIILSRLLKKNKDWFYLIELSVKRDRSMVISISDGDGNTYLKHPVLWTDFPIIDETVRLYLCESEENYCLMLPSEY